MCIYTVKKQKLKKKSSRGVRYSTERPKIRRFWRKGYTAKTNNDLGMSCYIQAEYSVFFCWKIFF